MSNHNPPRKLSKSEQYDKNIKYMKRLKEAADRIVIFKKTGQYTYDRAMRDAMERVREFRSLPSRI